MPIQKPTRPGRALKKFLIVIAAAIVVIVVAVVLLLPPIAARILTRSVDVDLPSGKGTLGLADVSLSWGGPQRVGKLTLQDGSGKRMADLSVEARGSLLGLALSGGNIGTVALSGTIDVTEDQLTAPPGKPAAVKPGRAPSGSGTSPAEPIEVPRGLRATLEAKPLTITYTPRADSGMQPVKVDGFEAEVTVTGTGEATLAVGAKSPTIYIKGSARRFVDSSGRLSLGSAEGDMSARIAAPGELIEALARLALKGGGTSTGSGGAAPTEVAADLKVVGGRLKLADPAKPATIKGPVPQAVLELLAGGGAALRIDGQPSVTGTIAALDLPLPDASGKADLRGGVLRAGVLSTPIAGSVSFGGGEAKPFRVEPISVEVASPDFAQALTLKAGTRGSYAGTDAGSLSLDAEVQGLLDDAGMVRAGLPGRIRAELALKSVPTGLADGLVSALGISLRDVVGPSLNAEVSARTVETAGSASIPLTQVMVDVSAAHLTARMAADIDEKSLRMTGEGMMVEASRLAPVITALAKDQGIEVSGQGRLLLTAKDVTVPLISGGLPDLGRAAAVVGMQVSGMTIEQGAGDRPLEVRSLDTRITIAGDTAPKVVMRHDLASGGRPFGVTGDIELAGLITKHDRAWPFIDVTPAAMRPIGRIDVKGLPSDLLGYLPAELRSASAELLGQSTEIAVTAPAEGDRSGKPGSVGLSLTAANVKATGSVVLDEKSINLGQTDINMTLTPRLVEALASQYAADVQPRPTLGKDARVVLTVFPTAVNLKPDKQPDMNTLRPVRAMLTSPDDIIVMNLPGGGEGRAINAGLRGVEAGLTWDQQDVLQREASLKASLFEASEPGAVITSIEALGVIANPPPNFEIKAHNIDTARVDSLIGRPGLLADLLGEAAGVSAKGRAKSGVQDVGLTVKSSRLDTSLALQRTAEAIRLTSPGSVDIEVPAAWANRYVFAPGPDGTPAPISMTESAKVSLRLDRLAIGAGETPLKPGVFTLGAKASSPTLRMRTADGQVVDVQSFSAQLSGDDAARGVAFDVETKQIGIGSAGGTNPVRAVGKIANLSDESGRIDASRAAITANVTGTLPTALIDALGNQQGMLVDLLGSLTKVDFKAQNLSAEGGSMEAKLNTDHASANVRGSVRDATFITDGTTNITLNRVTTQLSKRFFETTIPIISRVEKTEQDEPATVNAMGLTVPTDGDTRKINGVAQVDLGTLRFETSSFFGQLLKIAGGKESGQIGKRVKPFEFVAKEGVVSYEKIELPLGEFNIETRGKVDLNTRRMDVVTFVPFYAVAEELTAALKNVPGIDRLTMIPIRTHGSFDKPRSEVQMDLIVKEAIPSAIEKVIPDDVKKVIPKDIGEGLKDLFKKKEKQN